MPKKLVVCCDGTWNTPDQEEYDLAAPTNVTRLYNALLDDAGDQLKYYHPGVGTEGGLLAQTAGGVYGYGLSQNIMSGYAWIARNYAPGDQIYLFGFSRGAYTARSLGGMLSRCGIIDLRGAKDPFAATIPPAEAWRRVEIAYEQGYRWRTKDWHDKKWGPRTAAPVTDPADPNEVKIEFIGVWETVGALGIPNDLGLLNLLDQPENWSFHDTVLGPNVKRARHALAMDEFRASFSPTLWTDDKNEPLHDPLPAAGGPPPRVRQIWFPGVHSDVGGGYYERGLAEAPLWWMIEEAEAAGLQFDADYKAQVRERVEKRYFQSPLHNSLRGVWKALRSRPRNLPACDDKDRFHESGLNRLDDPPIAQSPYRGHCKLAVGQSRDFSIYANEHWNSTGLFLEAGATYEFKAAGEWIDRSITCGPGGTNDGKFQIGELAQIAGTVFGKIEALFKKATSNKQADFPMTRRVEKAPWFSLIGVIANDGAEAKQPENDGSPPDHEILRIGAGPISHPVTRPGYLYAFANDAWHFYDNNRGSVKLRVKRTA